MKHRITTASILAALALLALHRNALGSSWATPENVGVAAVEVKTGKVLWEAWAPEQVPEAHRNQARRVMKNWWDHFLPGPVPIDRRSSFEARSSHQEMTLELRTRMSDRDTKFPTLRFTDVRSGSLCESASHGFVVSGSTLHAVVKKLPSPGEAWKPAWSLDMKSENPEQRWKLYTYNDLVWVFGNDRVLIIRKNGDVLFDEPIDAGELPGKWKNYPPHAYFNDDELVLALFPEALWAFDRFLGNSLWSIPLAPNEKRRNPWYFMAPDKGLIFFKSTDLQIPGIAPAEGAAVVAVHRRTGEVAWSAASAEEAPAEFEEFVAREVGPQPFITKNYGPDKFVGPNSFFRRPDSFLSFSVARDSGNVTLGTDVFVTSPVKNWKETLNHLLVFSGDLVIRCFPRKPPAEGESWGPVWEFDFGHGGIKMVSEGDLIWILGSGRLVCLDLDGTVIEDFAAPKNLSFADDLWPSYTVLQLEPDVIFVSGSETTALDRITGRTLWSYSNDLIHHFSLKPDRIPGSDVVLIPTAGYPTPGIATLIGAQSGKPYWAIPDLPVDRSAWAVSIAEIARARGDRYVQIHLANGHYQKEGLTPEAIESIEEIANSEWPKTRSTQTRTGLYLKKLGEIEPDSEGPPLFDARQAANTRLFYWLAILESPPPEDRKTHDLLTRACIDNLEKGPAHEHAVVEKIFTTQCWDSELVNAGVIDRVLVDRGFRIEAAEWHRKRGDHERASEILLGFPETDNRQLLSWSFCDPSRTLAPGPNEVRLLVEQLVDQPELTVSFTHRFFQEHPGWIPEPFVYVLREQLKWQAKIPERPKRREDGTLELATFRPKCLELLHFANKPGDTPLFRAFLDHPLYWESRDIKRYGADRKTRYWTVTRYYSIRKMAAEILRKRGERIPDSVVWEEKSEVVDQKRGP